MALDYFGQNIESLVERIGGDITLRTYTNTGTDFNPVRTKSDTTIKAAVFDFEASEVDGSIIQHNDKEFVIASSATIAKQHKIVDGGKEYQIVKLEDVGPGQSTLMYIAQGRA